MTESIEIEMKNIIENLWEIPMEGINFLEFNLSDDIIFVFYEKEEPSAKLIMEKSLEPHVKIDTRGDTLEVTIGEGWEEDETEIVAFLSIPSPIPVKILGKTGNIRVDSIFGDISISGDCEVFVKDFRGENALVSGKNSDVEMEYCQGNITIETLDGDIELLNIDGIIKIRTESGNIEANELSGKVAILTKSADVQVCSTEGVIEYETDSGDIEVLETSGEVRLLANSGDVNISDSEGSFYAISKSGDIEVNESSGSFSLITNSGDILSESITIEGFQAETETGNIEILVQVLEEGASIDARTKSGNIDLTLPPEPNGKIRALTRTGDIQNFVKMFSYELNEAGDEKILEGIFSDVAEFKLPIITLQTVSGNISIK